MTNSNINQDIKNSEILVTTELAGKSHSLFTKYRYIKKIFNTHIFKIRML